MDGQDYQADGSSMSSAKKDIARNVARPGDQPQEDPSRSMLHYGKAEDPEMGGDRLSTENAAGIEPVGGGTDAPVQKPQEITPSGGEADPILRSPTGQQTTSSANGTSRPSQSEEKEPTSTQQTSVPYDLTSSRSYEPETITVSNGETPTAPAPEEGPGNTAPTDIRLDNTDIVENAEGAVVGKLTVIDPDAGDTHSFTLSDDRFEVVGGEVRLKPGVALNFEEAATIPLDVTATDGGGLSVTQTFEITVTDVNEGPESIALDGGVVISGEVGASVGRLTAVDPDAGDSVTYTVSDERFEVVGDVVRLKAGVFLSPEEGRLDLSITATDSGGLSKTETFELHVFDPPTFSVGSGFTADYFDVDGKLKKLSDIDWTADPTHSETTQDINYENSRGSFWEGGDTDTFGARIKGNIEVDEAGSFTFHLGGDDGAMLLVNGQPVIDNDGLHGFRTRSGEVELPEGNHHIEVLYFENTGHAGLRLEWEGPGIDGKQLVATPDDQDAAAIEGVPTRFDIEIGNYAENADITLEGLPQGTIVTVGKEALAAGEDGVIDLTGLDFSTLTVTPPIGSAGAFQPHLSVVQTGPVGSPIAVSHPLGIGVTEAHHTPVDVDVSGGFTASYYDVDQKLSRLDQIDWDSAPTHEEIVSDVNYQNSKASFWEGGSTDTFGARIQGAIEVEDGGTYTFFLGADDGAMLYVNGEPVIDNDGLHGFRTRKTKIDLEPGEHDIEVRYFENYGHAGLKLEWKGPDTDGRELVTAKPDLSIDQNGSGAVAIEFGNGAAVDAVFMDGLPADTVLFVGEQSFVSDGGPVDITGQDLSSVEIAPPAGFTGTIEATVSTVSKGFNGAQVTSETPFALTVGEGSDTVQSAPDDGSIFMMGGSQEAPDFAAWTQTDPSQDDSEANGDDVMAEEIVETRVSETPDQQFDTYERYDW